MINNGQINFRIIENDLKDWCSSETVNGEKREAAEKIKKAFEENATNLNLSGLGLTELPRSIGQLKHLKELHLNCNQLNSLPEELGQLSELSLIDLNYNRNLDDLPGSLGKIPTLQTILTGGTGISDKKCHDIVNQNRSLTIQEKRVAEKNSFQKDLLLFSQRSPEVQSKIDHIYETLKKGHSWGHSGSWGFYNLLNFDEIAVIAQRIETASPNKKDLYFIDLGAGHFGWVDCVAGFLKDHFSENNHHFHVIGVTGEGEPFDFKKVEGNVTTHKINGFKLENLLELFEQFDLHLVNSVEFIVTAWTLRHLVDPLGTLDQAYHLLTCGNGFLFGTGFDGHCPYSGRNSLSQTLSLAFGIHSYISRRSDSNYDSFALFRSDEDNYSRAIKHFFYDDRNPISYVGGLSDCFAECSANLKLKSFDDNVDVDFGGNFHGFGTYVLEQLLGNEEKKFSYRNLEMPLFKYGLHFLKMYLDDYGTYQVHLKKNENRNLR